VAYLFGVLGFPDYSRLTQLWNNTWAPPIYDGVATAHYVSLGDDQDADVESDFLSSHLPLHVGGFGGAYPDGRAWTVILQAAPTEESASELTVQGLLSSEVDRALAFNTAATLQKEVAWTRDELLNVYQDQLVLPSEVESWSMSDLLRGLLTQCCGLWLRGVVRGYPSCAFPDAPHACEGEVFTDAFSAWVERRIPQANEEESEPETPDRRIGRKVRKRTPPRTNLLHDADELFASAGCDDETDFASYLRDCVELPAPLADEDILLMEDEGLMVCVGTTCTSIEFPTRLSDVVADLQSLINTVGEAYELDEDED